MQDIFGLRDEEAVAVFEALVRDVGTTIEARRRAE
jgi:hypothetical protein